MKSTKLEVLREYMINSQDAQQRELKRKKMKNAMVEVLREYMINGQQAQ